MRNKNLKSRAKKQNFRKVAKDESKEKKLLMVIARFFLVAILAISSLGAIGYFTFKFFDRSLNSPIAHVEIKGDFNYLKKDQLSLLVENHLAGGFFRENLLELQKLLMKHPWTDKVYLRRQWPDKLKIQIIEQRPIARWSQEGFVNYRGELVLLEQNAMLDHLPVLIGSVKDSHALMRQYQNLSLVLDAYDLKIYALEKRVPGGWRIHLANGWKIIGGRSNVVQKTQKLMTMIANETIVRPDTITVFDLRYENGVAVQRQVMPQLAARSEGHY